MHDTDVKFKNENRPVENVAEGKHYFSGKQKMYGYKVEAPVLSNGICVEFTLHYAGSVSDIDIMRRNESFYQLKTKKGGSDNLIADTGNLRSQHPMSRAILVDKGYQGSSDFLRVITPKNKPRYGELTTD